MKVCRQCKIEKSFNQFYKHNQMFDGYLNKCIECVKARISKHRIQNLEKIRAYDRERGRTEKRLELNRERGRKFRERYKESGIKWRERNPEKRAAHVLLGNAMRARRIFKQPCEVCGLLKVEAHHDDYTKPLEVRWLCKKHHAEIHRKYKDLE